MATFETRFNALFLSLEAVMDCPEGFKEALKGLVKKAGFDALPAASPSTPSLPTITMKPTAKGGRRTGYNVFQTQRNAELKAANVDSSLRQSQIVSEWRAMGEEAKKKWNAIASGGNPTGTVAAPVKKLSGWNLYMKTEMEARKGKITKGGPAPLKAIGEAWKALGKVEQEKWNARAKVGIVAPKVDAKVVVAPIVSDEFDEDELAAIEEMEQEEEGDDTDA